MVLDNTESVPIFWVIAGDGWKKTGVKDPAKDKRDAAAKWFKKYSVNSDHCRYTWRASHPCWPRQWLA
jgi:hypothetical protein